VSELQFPIYTCPVLNWEVIDGDTVKCLIDRGWNDRKVTYLRLDGVDTPEVRTRDVLHKEAGNAAKAVAEHWIVELDKASGAFYASSDEKPKFYGRTVGRLFCVMDGMKVFDTLNSYLLSVKVAKPYEGGKREWTEAELTAVIKAAGELLA
jgi:endonuclease YncB( thermonuclease family)